MMLAKVVLSLALMVLQALSIQARFFEDNVDEALYGRALAASDTEPEDDCKDNNKMCPEWKSYGYCSKPGFREEKMETQCRKTCGMCSKYCRDREAKKCEGWKKQGFCERKFPKIRELMRQYCGKTCGYCSPKAAISKCAKASGSTFGCCWDGTEKADPEGSNCRDCKDVGMYALHVCKQFKSGCDNGGITESWMTRYCPATCGLCGHEGKCVDKELTLCVKWEENGYCDHENVDIKYRMIKYCAKTCGICEESGILTQ